MEAKPKLWENIICKLLADTILILSVIFLIFAIADAIIPGIITTHLNFYKLMIPLWLAIFGFNYFEKKIQPKKIFSLSSKFIYIPVALLGTMMFLILRSAGVWMNMIMLVFAVILSFLILRVFSEKN